MPATFWTAAVEPNALLPTVRSVAASVGLTEHVDWTWERQPAGWQLVVDATHGDALADALEDAGYDLAFYARHDLSIAERVRAQALARRMTGLLDAPWDDPLVRTALTTVQPGMPLYRDRSGRWQHSMDGGRATLRTEVTDATPHWCREVPGVSYDGRAAVVGLERMYAVARALLPVAPSLAVSMVAAHWLEEPSRPTDTDWLCRAPNLAALPPDLQTLVARLAARVPQPRGLRLREYQQIALAFAVACEGRVLIADAPGVGKTASALGILLSNVTKYTPALVVAPASVQTNWHDEIRQWGSTHLRPCDPNVHSHVALAGSVWVTTWGTLAALDLKRLGIQTVVFDEAHYAKHAESQRSQAAADVAAAVPHVVALTGTPLENRVTDLWHLLRLLRHPVPDLSAFKARYGQSKRKVIRGVAYIDDTRAALLPELKHDMQSVMLRRLKTDLAMELPEKTRVNVWVDLAPDVRRAYDDAEQNIEQVLVGVAREKRIDAAIQGIDRGLSIGAAVAAANQLDLHSEAMQRSLALLVLGHMRQVLGAAKVGSAATWIREFHATGEPLVAFRVHRHVQAELLRTLGEGRRGGPSTEVIDGTTPAARRGQIAKAFQQGRYDMLLCSVRAAGIGLNLFRASSVLFVERALVASEEEQAEDRIWRSGQRNACTAYYLMARNTVDERLDALITRKRALAQDVLRGETVSAQDQERRDLVDHDAAEIFAARVAQVLHAGVGDTRITEADVRVAIRRKSA